MYFNDAFGLCIGIKIQEWSKDYFHCCRLAVCKIFFFFIACAKQKFCKLQGFLFSGEEKGRYVCDFL